MREIERCPICSESARRIVYQATLDKSDINSARHNPYGAHYQINRCAGCGLMFSSPILNDEDIAALYQQAPHGNVTAGEEQNVKNTMRHYYELAKPYLKQRGRILDVGCDIGLMLEFAREDGFSELFGLEPNPIARRVAAAIPGAIISDRFYEQQEFPDGSFDLITLVHVLDHLVDPSRVVERALRHLKPGGIVVGVVHNIESALAHVMRERFPPFNMYHHYFFSAHTLAALFQSRGFETVKVASTKNCYSIGFFVRRLPGFPDRLKVSLAKALDAFAVGRIPLTIPIGNIGIVARRPLSH